MGGGGGELELKFRMEVGVTDRPRNDERGWLLLTRHHVCLVQIREGADGGGTGAGASERESSHC